MAVETITESEIWADLDAIFVLPERMPGDIDASQVQARYGGHENSARMRMKQLVQSGKWEFIIVRDDTSARGRRKIIRKVNNGSNS